MDLTLVPFGFQESERRLVDVHQVSSGKQCGCICPSCKAPLVARKGKKKIWHFAHDSKSEVHSKLEKCNHSFFVSARMMARQLIGEKILINLPKCEILLSENRIEVSEVITESRQLLLEGASFDCNLSGINVDLLGYVDGYSLAFVFSHPGREIGGRFDEFNDNKAGIIEIALEPVRERFRVSGTTNGSYSEILADFITNDKASKKWIYHPRLNKTKQRLSSKLKTKLENEKKRINQLPRKAKKLSLNDDALVAGLKDVRTANTTNISYEFNCRLCNSSWIGIGNKQADCQKCGNSILVSRNEIPGDET